jgi:hypothetical protein
MITPVTDVPEFITCNPLWFVWSPRGEHIYVYYCNTLRCDIPTISTMYSQSNRDECMTCSVQPKSWMCKEYKYRMIIRAHLCAHRCLLFFIDRSHNIGNMWYRTVINYSKCELLRNDVTIQINDWNVQCKLLLFLTKKKKKKCQIILFSIDLIRFFSFELYTRYVHFINGNFIALGFC